MNVSIDDYVLGYKDKICRIFRHVDKVLLVVLS